MEKPLLNIVFIFLIQFISRLLFFLHLKSFDVLIQMKKNNLKDNNIESKSAQR
jgi:heme/copper-type cytochrome/quinol oxidase subunit 4